jgi:hypothetical protein
MRTEMNPWAVIGVVVLVSLSIFPAMHRLMAQNAGIQTAPAVSRVDRSLLQTIQKGVTSKAEIEKLLGPPHKLNGLELTFVPGAALLYQYLWNGSQGEEEATLVYFDKSDRVVMASQARITPGATPDIWTLR